MRSNDFRGATLAEAVSKATAVYRNRSGFEQKNNFCSGLRRQYEQEKTKLDVLQKDIGDLEAKIGDLKQAAARANLTALVLAAGTAARAATKWRVILNLLRRLKLDKDALDALQGNGSDVAAAISALLLAFFGLEDQKEAEKIEKEVVKLQARSNEVIEKMEDLAQSFLNGNCHLQNLQS